jgi:hypothetical protein
MPTPIEEVNELRNKILQGYEPTPEEMHKAFSLLRSERGEAVVTAGEKRAAKAAAAEPINLQDLFGKPLS